MSLPSRYFLVPAFALFSACSGSPHKPGCTPPTGDRLAEFERLHKEGMNEYARYHPREAIQKLEAAAAINPCGGSIWNDLGIAYNMANQKKKAIETMRHGLEMDPSFTYTRLNLGVVYEESVQLDDAAREFAEFARTNDKRGAGYRFLGLVEIKRAHWAEAEKALLRAVELGQADDAEVWAALGDVAERRSDLTTAEERYRQALTRDPHAATANFRLARVLDRAGRTPEAAQYQAAYDRSKELDLRLDHARAALRDDPTQAAGAHGAMGSIYLEFGRNDLALRHFEKSVGIDPGRSESLLGLAEALRRAGRLEEAERMALEARALKPEAREATAALVAIRATGGRLEEALAELDKTLAVQPDWSEGHLSRGLLEQQLGRWGEAARSLETFVEQRPEHLLGHETLLAIYLNAADPKVRDPRKAKALALMAKKLGSTRRDLLDAALR